MLKEFIEEGLFNALERAKAGICSIAFDRVVIVHHNDADGICAGAILQKSFSALGFKPTLYCIERVHPAIVEKIHRREGALIVYTDLGGLAGKVIRDADGGRNLVLILDHHPARHVSGNRIIVVAPELLGVSGDVFISASTLAYLFCRQLTGLEMEGCASLAVVGSVGDYHDRSGGILGYDRYALDQALHAGEAKIKIVDSRERYFLQGFKEFADVVAERLTTLGSVGYYEGGFRLAREAALHGFDERTVERAEELKKLREERFRQKIRELKQSALRKERYVQWFHVGKSFAPMGVKVIGLFCHMIKDMSFIDESRFVAGFQDFIPELPELGRIDWEGVKVSFRAPAPLERRVLRGEVPGLDVTLPLATERVHGSADASHRIAAASMIDKGKEEQLIREWEAVMKELSSPSLSSAH